MAIRVANDATLRRQLGRELRKARMEAGLTQSAIAAKLGCGQGKINKIETTLVSVSGSELEVMLETYGVPPEKADQLRELATHDNPHRRGSRLMTSRAFEQLSDREPDASEILSWHSERIPGPLQSEHYMYRLFNTDERTSDGEIIRLARERQARTRIFTTENPPRYRVILSESSLHRMPGGRSPGLVLDQVEHLLAFIKAYERFTLQILTFDARLPYVDSDFVLLRFAGDEEDFVYIEYPGGSRIFTKSKELAMFDEHWRELRDAALGADESMKFLDRMAAEYRAMLQATGDG